MSQADTLVGLVPIRNTQAGLAVFKDEQQNFTVTWAGAGDPHGQDVQLIPEFYLTSHPQFVKIVSRGVLVRADGPEAQRADVAQANTSPGADLTNQAAQSIHREDNKDLVGATCIAPGTRSGVTCGADALVPNGATDVPPLCSQHKHLAPSCVIYTDADNNEKWTVATMGQRTTESGSQAV